MSETVSNEATSTEPQKPVPNSNNVIFPPFPDPTDEDFEDDISEEERNFYKSKISDINNIQSIRLHCTACDRHLGCSARNEARMRSHPMLRTLVCHTCHTFYNSGEFDKGDDGSELYCRWCGQGGQVYCCSDCPHVFCAKCIKRNLGMEKIKEIENLDDWKCFKCNPNCLWDLRAVCWALLRYCDLKNKIAYKTVDPTLKEAYLKDCSVDHSTCCKNKSNKRKEKQDSKKKESDNPLKKNSTAAAISKIPPTIQVKKFASIVPEEPPKREKKAQKRPLSPKNQTPFMKNPIKVAACAKIINPISIPSMPKKVRMSSSPLLNPVPYQRERNSNTYTRIRPKLFNMPQVNILNQHLNGFNNPPMFNNMIVNDNINLSLESLTQGLDMAAVAAMSSNTRDNNVVCTPDFPLEPLCEVTEDNADDDVQCITPGPVAAPKLNTPPPLVSRLGNSIIPDLSPDNIIQMTENDVTVNAQTGGLKFRVDPQTLSSNKMYRLPDGRIFAINANPNMPGGYSATIVAVTESTTGKVVPKGATYAAKLSAVTSSQTSTPPILKSYRSTRVSSTKEITPKTDKITRATETTTRECDLNVPIEWFRYNLVDAVDALEYSLSRLQKLKKEASTMYLRTRSIGEMRSLHRTLERLLCTSSSRFKEIRDSLNKEMKQYVMKKMGSSNNNISDDDDDDDVEILNDLQDNDDPIFIDENSVESSINESRANDSHEVDLTGLGSSEPNESGEKSMDHNDSLDTHPPLSNQSNETCVFTKMINNDIHKENDNVNEKTDSVKLNENDDVVQLISATATAIDSETIEENKQESKNSEEKVENINGDIEKTEDNEIKDIVKDENNILDTNGENEEQTDVDIADGTTQHSKDSETKVVTEKTENIETFDDKNQDAEMSEEMIETLLKGDNGGDDTENLSCLEIPDLQET